MENKKIFEKHFTNGMSNKDFKSFEKTHPRLLGCILNSMEEVKCKSSSNDGSFKIFVDTEEAKQKMLDESRYIHDFVEIVKYKTKKGKTKEKWVGLDSNKAGGLMHLYMMPEVIVVGKNNKAE